MHCLYRRINASFETGFIRKRHLHKSLMCKLAVVDSLPSYLYVGRSKLPFTVEPDLDFRETFKNVDLLKSVLKLRKIDDFDIDYLSKRYSEIWPHLKQRRLLLDEIDSLSDKLKAGAADKDVSESGIRTKIDHLRVQLKAIDYKEDWDRILAQCLNLPNQLDYDTPTDVDQLILNDSSISIDCKRPLCNHMDFLNRRNLIRFKINPDRLYLTDIAGDIYRFIDRFVRFYFDQIGKFRLTSPSHFAKSCLVEAYDSRYYYGNYNASALSVDVDAENSSSIWALNLVGQGALSFLSLLVERCFSAKNEYPLLLCSLGNKDIVAIIL